MGVSVWSNVGVAVQSALDSAKPITGITKANPAVVTSTAHGYANGDFVVMNVQGMSEMNGRVVRVANQTTNTWEAEGVDSTNFGTFSSGSSQEVTYGTAMSTARSLSASGGSFDFIDTTTIHDTVKTQIPGAASPATYTFTSHWDPADAALVALKAASDIKGLLAIRFTFASGAKVVFTGYIGATLLPVGNAQDLVTTEVVITMFGKPTVYSS